MVICQCSEVQAAGDTGMHDGGRPRSGRGDVQWALERPPGLGSSLVDPWVYELAVVLIRSFVSAASGNPVE